MRRYLQSDECPEGVALDSAGYVGEVARWITISDPLLSMSQVY